jgi:Ca-activated chloride channel family protein
MRRTLFALALFGLAGSTSVRADGLLIPTDRSLPPLRLFYQRVEVMIEGQVATTKVEQSYHNSTDRDLEAEYIFPLPAGASVHDFSMWVDGKRFAGKAVDANAARQTYEDIVRRLQDPGLLEFIGRDLWKMRIYPVPRRGEQKIQLAFTSILPRIGDMISYQYQLRTGEIRTTEKDFTMVVRIKSPDPLGPVYSPSHDVEIVRQGDRAAVVSFERNACQLDKDFQLYFVPKSERVGFSLFCQRESPGGRGYFLLLLSPSDPDESIAAPRDLVLVVDTSSSMDEEKLRQAKGAVSQTLNTLGAADRFALISFATAPVSFRDDFCVVTKDNLCAAREWVESLEAAGGTDIAAALEAALGFRHGEGSDRALQILLLTDGLPTVGLKETPEILELLDRRECRGIRLYTFGVGDDVDAHLLDLLAEKTFGCSTYVRPNEDLEAKVSALAKKIGRPVRTDLKLTISGGPRLVEMYPPRLPDLFQGDQIQVAGRFEGHGPAKITLQGRAGDQRFSESFRVEFPEVATDHNFVAPIWARRKVGYLLDQIRLHGESVEVKKELVKLAHDYSIATPYTSLLVVPESAASAHSVARRAATRRRHFQLPSMPPIAGGFGRGMGMAGMGGMGGGMGAMRGGMGGMGGGMGMAGMGMGGMGAGMGAASAAPRRGNGHALASAPERQSRDANDTVDPTRDAGPSIAALTPSGKEAIDLAERIADLKAGSRAERSTSERTIAGRRFRKAGEAWVDETFKSSMATVRLRVLGQAYFRLLAAHPELYAIFALGNRVTWVSPSGTALVIDKQGQDNAADALLKKLFDRDR